MRKALYLKVCGWVQALRDNLAKKGVWLDAVCPITGIIPSIPLPLESFLHRIPS